MTQSRTDLILRHSERLIPRYTSYPTAPHFRAGFSDPEYRTWLSELDGTTQAASLYIHVPYCRTMCWYCGCHTKATARDKPVEAYLDTLLDEIELLAGTLPCRQPLNHIHWGGGSPTIVSPARFEAVMKRIGDLFDIRDNAEIAVEVDPRQMTPDLAAAFARSGVNRASLGIQTFDVAVQLRINRLQPFDLVQAAVERLRGAGIDRINADLLYGLPAQTIESVAESARKVLTLDPWRVSSFGYAHVPSMKRHQRMIVEDELPGPSERLAQADTIAWVLGQAGFRQIGLDHFARETDEMATALAEGKLRRNFQGYTTDQAEILLGVGPSAIGQLPRSYVQNSPDTGHWKREIAAGRLPVAKGLDLNDDDRMRRDIIEGLMCNLTVDVAAVAAAYGMSPPAFDLSDLVAQGIVSVDGTKVTVSPDFRVLTRVAAAAFDAYLDPEHKRHSMAV